LHNAAVGLWSAGGGRVIKTNRSTLHTVCNRQQGSNTHVCHAGQQQQPGLAQRVKAARNRQRQVICQRSDQMVDLQQTVCPHKWSPVSCRSSVGQEKFACEMPMFYHCTTQPTS